MRKFTVDGLRCVESDLIWPATLESYRRRSTSTRYYNAGRSNAAGSITVVVGANIITLLPWVSPQTRCSFISITFKVSTALAGSNARLGVYTNVSRKTLYPNALLFDSGLISTASTGSKPTAISPAIDIAPGTLIWIALATSGAITVAGGLIAGYYPFLGLTTALGATPQIGYQNAFAFAALPNPCTSAFATFAAAQVPLMGVALG